VWDIGAGCGGKCECVIGIRVSQIIAIDIHPERLLVGGPIKIVLRGAKNCLLSRQRPNVLVIYFLKIKAIERQTKFFMGSDGELNALMAQVGSITAAHLDG